MSDQQTPPAGSGRLVSLALDPVLVPAGFLPGQHGPDGDGGVEVIFCATHDELSRRHPLLPQVGPPQRGACVDLVVDVRSDGTLERLDLEELTLHATLRQVGLVADSAAVARLTGQPVADGLPAIARALGRLLGGAD